MLSIWKKITDHLNVYPKKPHYHIIIVLKFPAKAHLLSAFPGPIIILKSMLYLWGFCLESMSTNHNRDNFLKLPLKYLNSDRLWANYGLLPRPRCHFSSLSSLFPPYNAPGQHP